MSTLKLNALQSRSGNGDITVASGSRLVVADSSGFSGYNSANGSIVQMQHTSVMPTAHISTTTTAEVSVGLIAGITPKFSTSRIHVRFYSTMALGSGTSPLILLLYRRINGGAFTVLTPFTNAAVRYSYGWTYMSGDNWGPINNTYIDRPATTGFVEYVVNYRLISGSTVSYLVHQYQEYGYELTEVA